MNANPKETSSWINGTSGKVFIISKGLLPGLEQCETGTNYREYKL